MSTAQRRGVGVDDLELEHGRHPGSARGPSAPGRARGARRERRALVLLLAAGVVVTAWWFALAQEITPLPAPLDVLDRASRFVAALGGLDAGGPGPYGQGARWALLLDRVRETLVMAVLASGLAGGAALASVAFASRILTVGEFGFRRPPLGRAVLLVTRTVHVTARGVPEFVWALLLVFVLGANLLTGALALALHEVGVLGRLASDVVDDVERGSLRALHSSGARTVTTFAYGVLPQVLPQLVTFLLYRWEVVVRATVVVGFVTGAGLGEQLHRELVGRHWPEFGQVLLAYVALVLVAEAVAVGLRRLAR